MTGVTQGIAEAQELAKELRFRLAMVYEIVNKLADLGYEARWETYSGNEVGRKSPVDRAIVGRAEVSKKIQV